METIDPTREPFLSGRYAPVHDELDVTDLAVEGDLPRDLDGAYLRNGPNPEFTPLGSYTFPLEGDGMVHGVWLDSGCARYRNRTVRTRSLLAEQRAGRALFGGIMTPAFPDPALLGDDPDPTWPFKLDAFINVVRHAGRTLALEECAPAYELAADLTTAGRFDWAGALPKGICAHPKIDPVTGEMIAFSYDVTQPFLTWQVIAADGTVSRPPTPIDGLDGSCMVHDCSITERYLVLVLGPLVFDVDAMASGGPMLAWKPEDGTRIALVPRDGGPVRWIETEAMWAWHHANAFDDGDRVQLDLPWSTSPGVFDGDQAGRRAAGFTRMTLDPVAGSVSLCHLDARSLEFPRIDDRRLGGRHRYVVIAGRSDDARLQRLEHDRLWQYDMVTGRSEMSEPGAAIGEAVFAPRTGGTDELDGYYLAIGTDLASGVSALYVWDAPDVAAGPRARVVLPRRVPNGLHGNWFPAG